MIGAAAVLLLAACTTNLQPSGLDGVVIQAFEAEDATIAQSVLVVREDADTSGGKVLVQPDSIKSAAVLPREDAHIQFTVDEDGERFLWARVKGESLSRDAIYVGFNGRLERIYPEDLGEYVWLPVTFQSLEAGQHTISIGHAEPEMSLDVLVVTSRIDMTAEDIQEWLESDRLPTMPSPEAPRPEFPEPPSGPAPIPDPGDDPAEDPGEDPVPAPGPTPNPPAPEPPAPQPPPAQPTDGFGDLRGNPNFKVSSLSPTAQIWYRRLWSAIEDPISEYNPDSWAKSDNTYTYARQLHTYVQSLAAAFRVTGDLKLLDEIDRLAELMRAKLADSWRNTLDGSRQNDGYLNWVWRYSSGDSYVGKDTNKLDEIKTHALIASIAYALDVNRDLKSPAGRNYGAHADFWTDYLINHFEAKWRSRQNRPTGFPIMLRPHTHTYYSWMKWHYYMGLLTGKSGYTQEADRMADMLWDNEILVASSPSGPAYVWNRSVLSEGGQSDYLHPTTYARYVYSDVVELHFEGFNSWASTESMTRFARTIAEWVIDPEGAENGNDWFSSDIGGGKPRAGIRVDSSWGRMTTNRYEITGYAMLMPWDSSQRIEDITIKVTNRIGGPDKPRTVYLPAAFLVNEVLAGR